MKRGIHLTKESQRIVIVCDADFSNRDMYKRLRETISIKDMTLIHKNSKEYQSNPS